MLTMLRLLKKLSKVVEPTDDIVNKIYNDLNGTLPKEVIVNLISTQSYLAFNLGVINKLKVRFPKLGIFKVNHKAIRAKSIFKYILDECDGDKEAANKVIKNLRDKDVLKTLQV